ncbi:MAG: glycosyltransferase family 2 protein [bacterium]|nr:glycosyltransferase family 2 protein [bacterium]
MKEPLLSVIIVTHNNSRYIKQCLDTLFVSLKDIHNEVFVIDNASTDDTIDILKKYKKKFTFVMSKKNVGFGKANNEIYKCTKGAYVWLVNPDVFVDNLCAKKMVSFLNTRDDIGIVGAQMRNVDGSMQGSFGYRPTFWREVFQQIFVYRVLPIGKIVMPGILTAYMFKHSHGVSWVSGGCMMIRRRALKKNTELFNPTYFMYVEDVDLCLRIQNQGYRVWYLSSAVLTHIHSGSFGHDVGRYTYANILEAHSILSFWKLWHSTQVLRYTCLRFLLKTKLAVKLLIYPTSTMRVYSTEMQWQSWKKI